MASKQKIVDLGLLLASAAVFLFLNEMVKALWALVSLPRSATWLIEPHTLVALALAALGFVIVRRHQRANQFLNDAVGELMKVTWPERKETILSTGVSCVLVAICVVVLFAFDSLWRIAIDGVFSL